jgi:hypothetical protein
MPRTGGHSSDKMDTSLPSWDFQAVVERHKTQVIKNMKEEVQRLRDI